LPGLDETVVVGDETGGRGRRFGEGGDEVTGGEHARVRAVELLEVEVRGVFAGEDRAGLGHQRLDARVSDLRSQRAAAGGGDRLRHAAGGDEVVDDGRPLIAG